MQKTAAGRTRKMYKIVVARIRHQLRVANGALCMRAFRLIVNHVIAARLADPGGHAVGFHINDVAAAAFYMSACKKARAGLRIIVTYGTCDYKFAHAVRSFGLYSALNISLRSGSLDSENPPTDTAQPYRFIRHSCIINSVIIHLFYRRTNYAHGIKVNLNSKWIF